MKIQLLRLAHLSLFCLVVIVAQSQPLATHKLTPQEVKQRGKITVENNVAAKLTPAQKAKAADRGHAMAALILKAILHRTDPKKYPMDVTTASVEKNIWQAVEKLSPAIFDSISKKAKQTLADPVKKNGLLGKYNDLNFQEVSLLAKIKMKSGIEFKPVGGIGPVSKNNNMPAIDAYDKIDIEIKSVDCIARTTLANPYDFMILTGLLVGASGNTNDANSVGTCQLIDGLTCDFNNHRFGSYSLNTVSGFPKTFYCILVLVRSGREDQSVTTEYFDNIMSMISPAVVSPEDGMDGMVASVIECINYFSDEWFSEDRPLIPYAVKFQLNNLSMASTNNGASGDFQTGDILEFGNPQRWGKYRINYLWRLRK